MSIIFYTALHLTSLPCKRRSSLTVRVLEALISVSIAAPIINFILARPVLRQCHGYLKITWWQIHEMQQQHENNCSHFELSTKVGFDIRNLCRAYEVTWKTFATDYVIIKRVFWSTRENRCWSSWTSPNKIRIAYVSGSHIFCIEGLAYEGKYIFIFPMYLEFLGSSGLSQTKSSKIASWERALGESTLNGVNITLAYMR